MKSKPVDEKVARLLKSVVDHFDQEDRIVRNAQLRHYRRLKLYWNNFSQIFWSEAARDYRIYTPQDLDSSNNDQDFYDRPINVFRAFLETIIAALSIQIPAIACVPDDADNANDLSTAKAGDKIGELIYKHNDVVFFWLYALYVHCTEGMVAAYTYEKEDESYGTYKEKQYENDEVDSFVCPHCQAKLEDSLFSNPQILPQLTSPEFQAQVEQQNEIAEDFSSEEMNEFAPSDNDIELHGLVEREGPVCPDCGAELDPELQKTKLIIPRFVGMTDKPKGRICLEVHGGLYVKIANYASKQQDTPYLIYSYETHYANVLECYPHLWEDIPRGGWSNVGITDPYEQYARINPQYRNAFPEEQVTVKNSWLRPASFNILPEEDAKFLKRKFPDGARAVMVNTLVAEAENEALDDCWTLTKNPLHDYLNHDPLGELLVNIQDIVNDLISLTLQTIEHGIAQTWADPAVVNFSAQGQIEATPGYITPTKLQGGAKNISDAFFSTKSASLSPEIFQFYQIINQLGQFVSAAMPSIFGGSQESGSSRTAAEYSMSRTASLQRLQTPWRMFTIWWKNIFGKAIPAYMKLMKDDEKFVKKDDAGNFVNVFIRKAELSGKIGSVELEGSEQIPISDEQKAELIMRLMELNNMEVMQALISPENLPFIRKVVKMPEFKLAGEADRQKQLEEIQLLLQSEPIVLPPDPQMIMMAMQTGQMPPPNEQPSIEIDPLVDDHAVESQVCRSWAISEAGRLAKQENPNGYKNVLLHMKLHMEQVVQQQMNQLSQQAQQNPSPGQEASGNQQQASKPQSSTSEVNNGSGTSIQ